jgi:hypothetical protein
MRIYHRLEHLHQQRDLYLVEQRVRAGEQLLNQESDGV